VMSLRPIVSDEDHVTTTAPVWSRIVDSNLESAPRGLMDQCSAARHPGTW
jgi:hypothetical protein